MVNGMCFYFTTILPSDIFYISDLMQMDIWIHNHHFGLQKTSPGLAGNKKKAERTWRR